MLQLVQLEEVTWMVMQIHMRWLHCRAGQGRAVLQAIRVRRQLWATKGQVQRRAGQGRAVLQALRLRRQLWATQGQVQQQQQVHSSARSTAGHRDPS